MIKPIKPLGIKTYGSIPHLPGSRLGPGDRHCEVGQARIATEKTRDKHDLVIVQEKLDGSCVSVAKIEGKIIPLTRAGYRVEDSRYEQHHVFGEYVMDNYGRFDKLLNEGERVCGEWLYMAHGTIYNLPHEPFVAFDIIRHPNERLTYGAFFDRCFSCDIETPAIINGGSMPMRVAEVEYFCRINGSKHGAVDGPEGAVWRVERKGKVDFLVKYVTANKIDGKHFPESNNGIITLNTYHKWKQ